jgi:hypothetical protein
MGYLGYKPADKPLTAADITDGIITSAKIVDGTIVNADINASAAIVASKLSGIGKVLQVVQGNTSTTVSSTSATFADTGLSASITPSSASSKILVFVCQGFYNSGAANGNIRLVKNSTTLITQGYSPWDGVHFLTFLNFQYLDNPATTSSITYKTTFNRSAGAVSLHANYSDGGGTQTSFITLMEIAG